MAIIKLTVTMKKIIYVLILSLLVVSGIVFANRETKNEASEETVLKPLSAAEIKAAKKEWESTPAGVQFKQWEASPAGLKVHASAAKIRKYIKDSSNMEGVVTSLSLPEGSRLGFGVMVKIDGEDYILTFGPESFNKNRVSNNEFKQLRSLKVNDKIMIKSHFVSYAPKYSYPILAGAYVEREGKIIYKRVPRKGGC